MECIFNGKRSDWTAFDEVYEEISMEVSKSQSLKVLLVMDFLRFQQVLNS